MKKIAFAFGIIACLAVFSMLLTSASAQDDEFCMNCPGGYGDQYMDAGDDDPAIVRYLKSVRGMGYEDCQSSAATHMGNRGLEFGASSRGSAMSFWDYQMVDIDTDPDNPVLNITSEVNKSYISVVFRDKLVNPINSPLSGDTCVRSYLTGSMVSEKYLDTYDISGVFTHTGNATHSLTTIANRSVYGTSRFAVTIKDIEEHHHEIMRIREEYTGSFEMDREVEVDRYLMP